MDLRKSKLVSACVISKYLIDETRSCESFTTLCDSDKTSGCFATTTLYLIKLTF